MGQDTLVAPVPQESELVLLAELAFASRHVGSEHTQAARNLIFLSPDALDMDLSDPVQRDFGDYELLEKIGRGGMGLVYRAHQRSLDREVALKLLVAGPWAPPRFIERFRSEAQSAARLEHPNIVTVYETGSQHDLQYFSMRLVRGESLAALLARQGRMPPRDTARMLRIVAEAVDYAHRLGVLHLDLKPGNVLLDESGEPLVADFGLARRVDEALADQSGDASGTPSYMAPEQADARTQGIGRATDIYGLGCVLYECLTGRPPFAAATPQATLAQVLREEVQAPRDIDPGIPRDIEAICLKCLHKDPAERYATAAELAEDLRSYLDDRPVSVRQSPLLERTRRWARREPRFAAAVAGVALVLLGGLAATSQQWQRAEGNALAARQLIWEGRREAALRLEQDGQGLESLARLVENLVEQEEAGELGQAALERVRIGLLRGQGARLIDSFVVADANPMAVAVSPDGTSLALAFNDLSVRWYDAESLEERGRVSLADRPTSDGVPRPPQLLRFVDAQRLLVTLEWYGNYVSPTAGDSWLVDLDRAAVVEPPAEFADFADAIFSANGQWALLRNRSGGVQLWQTTPWKPQSALMEEHADTLAWLLDHEGRYAFGLGHAMRGLSLYDLRNETSPRQVSLPGEAGVSAWTLSPDGRQLALGDFESRVFLLDTATLVPRQLPAMRGREITWLTFSEDQAWLAIAEFNGLAQVIDVASGDLLLSGEMRSQFALQRVGVSRGQRLLIAAGAGESAMWRIPATGVFTKPAHRIGVPPAAHGLAGRYPLAWSLEQGLVAGAGMDGQVRLWRLPIAPTASVSPGRQVPDRIHHASGRLVDTHWNRLRLVSPQGRPLSPWLQFAQPPGFAELLDDGRLLFVTIGTEAHVLDTGSMSRRYAPVPLPASPQRMLASADGRYVLLSFGGHGERGHVERLLLFDAQAGRWRPGEALLDGPVLGFSMSADNRWIVAMGQADGVTSVLRSDGLELIAEFPHDPFEPVVATDFQDHRLLLATRAADRRFGRDSLLLWDPFEDRIDASHDTGAAVPLSVKALGEDSMLAGVEYDLRIGREGRTARLPRVGSPEGGRAMALSPDGRLVARAYRHQVQLHDAASGDLVGPPLVTDRDGLDSVADVGFTADGRAVRAHSILGYRLQWNLEPADEPASELQAGIEQLGQTGKGQAILYAPSGAERRRLRAADPGAWRTAEARPAIPMATDAKPGVRLPARPDETSALLLDLSPVYDMDPIEVRNVFWNAMPTLRRFPAGTQHIAGIDFDIRGVALIGATTVRGEDGVREVENRITCLPLPAVPAAAIHLLARSTLTAPAATGETLAGLTLHYQDGERVTMPLRAGVELPGFGGDDRAVPLVLATEHALTLLGGPQESYSAPRIENPYPGRLPRCLDLESAPGVGPLVLLAITVEAPGEAATVIAPVISSSIHSREATSESPAVRSGTLRRVP